MANLKQLLKFGGTTSGTTHRFVQMYAGISYIVMGNFRSLEDYDVKPCA